MIHYRCKQCRHVEKGESEKLSKDWWLDIEPTLCQNCNPIPKEPAK
jgi:hypothetical protein